LLFVEDNSGSCFTSGYAIALAKIEETQTYYLGPGQFLNSITFSGLVMENNLKNVKASY
jgi:hypothetical protein